MSLWYTIYGCGKVGPAVSLRKSPTLTPALLASNRRNAKKSTGPRTARGKAWSRLNHLQNGLHSLEYMRFLKALTNAPAGRVRVTAEALLATKPAIHHLFREFEEICVQVEIDMCNDPYWERHWEKQKKMFSPVRSRNVIENT